MSKREKERSEWEAAHAERLRLLSINFQRYVKERDEMADKGKAIGTFIGWQYANNLAGEFKIPERRG